MKKTPSPYRVPVAMAGATNPWHASNRALARLLDSHRRALAAAIATADAIACGIDELTPLMVALCRRTCRFCPEPCCITNTVWFDFQDLLFFHLTGAPIPIRQAASAPTEACPFLGHGGCTQPPRLRPWMCIQYLCPAQRAILEKQGQNALGRLLHKIETIKIQRSIMEKDIVRCIKTNRRIKKTTDGHPMPDFSRYIGIDYSGAETPDASLKGLRVYMADHKTPPAEVPPPSSPRKYWTRRGLAGWVVDRLSEETPTLVGIDHGFSFPLRYFEVHRLPPDWTAFLEDFQRHWPTDEASIYVNFIRDGSHGDGASRMGNSRWRRLTEERTGRAKSVFHFDVPGSVAKSTHAGLPWLRFMRRRLGGRVHFWPFDGWAIPPGRSAVAEVYPSLWSRDYAREGRTSDQHDAYCAAAWLRQTDQEGRLAEFLRPPLATPVQTVARVEGWILGVL